MCVGVCCHVYGLCAGTYIAARVGMLRCVLLGAAVCVGANKACVGQVSFRRVLWWTAMTPRMPTALVLTQVSRAVSVHWQTGQSIRDELVEHLVIMHPLLGAPQYLLHHLLGLK